MSTLHAQTSSDRDLVDLVITYRLRINELRKRIGILQDEAKDYEAELWDRCTRASNYIETESGIACLTPWPDPERAFTAFHLDVERVKEAAK